MAWYTNSQYWTASNASQSVPSSLGYVGDVLNRAAMSHRLGLPCCSNYNAKSANDAPGEDKTIMQDIRVYPNPAYSTVYFEWGQQGDATIKLMDISGRTMTRQGVRNARHASIDVKGYAPGLYVYHIIANGKTKTGKILIAE